MLPCCRCARLIDASQLFCSLACAAKHARGVDFGRVRDGEHKGKDWRASLASARTAEEPADEPR